VLRDECVNRTVSRCRNRGRIAVCSFGNSCDPTRINGSIWSVEVELNVFVLHAPSKHRLYQGDFVIGN
jgi:hypothetical protein